MWKFSVFCAVSTFRRVGLRFARAQEIMKAIFLDIDGVICCNQFGRLEDRKLQLLRQVVQQTGAKIVLSTDWRRVPKLKSQLIGTLRDYGMDVIGATPMRAPRQPVRPQEITDWCASYNQQALANGADPITTFVAVDDRSLLQEAGGEGLRGTPHPAAPRTHSPPRAHVDAPSSSPSFSPFFIIFRPPFSLLTFSRFPSLSRAPLTQAASCTRGILRASPTSAPSAWPSSSSTPSQTPR